MTGERIADRPGSSSAAALQVPELPQPGGRPAAPGELAIVQAFVNSHFDLGDDWGADLLATPGGLEDWLVRRGLLSNGHSAPTAAGLARAIAMREGLRALAAGGGGGRRVEELSRAAAPLSLRLEFGPAGVALVPVAADPLDRALGGLLAIAYRAIVEGSWQRLKVCPGEHCGWAFYDASRNRSGRWCSMSVCGGRAKARSHYRRRRTGGG